MAAQNGSVSEAGAPTPSPSKDACQDYGGYSHDFVVEPSEQYNCEICSKVLRDPHLTGCCGQEFCETCLEKWRKSSKKPTCPHCRAEDFSHMLNKRSKREISQFKIRCSNHKQGCKWEGELLSLEQHSKLCDFEDVQCGKCKVVVKRGDLEKHQTKECRCRTSKCTYCSMEDMHWVIVSLTHMAVCSGYPTACPNGCGELKRSMLPAHQKVCPLELVDCPFKDAGCNTRILRKDIEKHSETNTLAHLSGVMAAFQRVQCSLSETQKQVTVQGQQLTAQRKQLKEMKMFRATLEDSMKGITSCVNDLLALKETTGEQAGALHMIKTLTGTSVRQLDKEHPVISFTVPKYSCYVSSTPGQPATALALLSTLKLSVPSSTPTPTKKASPTESLKTKVWTSQPFFVEDGYKMSMQVTIVQDYLTVKLVLLKGELDNELEWPCSVDFKCVHVSLVSEKHVGVVRYCIGEQVENGEGATLCTSVGAPRGELGMGPGMRLTPGSLSECVVWNHTKFVRCPLPAQCVRPDGSIMLRLAWFKRQRAVSPKREITTIATTKRRFHGGALQSSHSGISSRATPGFTFVHPGSSSRPGNGFAAGLLFGQTKPAAPTSKN